jgi:hypothetical protein
MIFKYIDFFFKCRKAKMSMAKGCSQKGANDKKQATPDHRKYSHVGIKHKSEDKTHRPMIEINKPTRKSQSDLI